MKTLAMRLQEDAYEAARLQYRAERAEANLEATRRAVDGNAILVLKTGFSRPIRIAATPSMYGPGYTMPHYFSTYEHTPGMAVWREVKEKAEAVVYTELKFRDSGRDDKFGRRVYEQV